MFLKEIYLKNYKCFEKKTFSFDKRFTVLVGDNGSGKTALLDGIAKAFAHLQAKLSNGETNDLENWKNGEIRLVSHKVGVKTNLERQRDAKIRTTIFVDEDKLINWHYGPGGGELQYINDYINKEYLKVQEGSPVILPIIAYYKTNRYWPSNEPEKIEPYEIGSRLDTYHDCLNPNTDIKRIYEWFLRMELISFKRKSMPPEYEAVSDAIIKSIETLKKNDSSKVQAVFSPEDDELMIDIGNGKEFPFRLLSGGQRNLIGMIADIAYRMAELNPHVTTDTPGIVLIDELDLHLHPKWQRNVVGDLKRIFPNCQFIVTTHSPFIIQSLSSDDAVIILDNEQEEVPEDFINKSIEDIVEEIQGVENPQWSMKRQKMYDAAKKYFQLLEKMNARKDEKEINRLREELELITRPFAANVAYTAFLEQKKLVKEASLANRVDVLNEPEPSVEYRTKKKGKN